jgi:hypothetical protein
MTTTTMTTPVAAAVPGNRILSVIRLHFVNPQAVLGLPWMILGFIFVANLAIWAIILASSPEVDRADISQGLGWSGAISFVFVYMMVVSVQAINATFPFALGYSITRREYYIGTSIVFVILALIYSVGLSILSAIEDATNGWGLGGRMFTSYYFGDGGALEHWFIYFALLLFFLFTGSALAGVWVRWKAFGITTFFIALGALLIGLLALIGLSNSWLAVGEWFVAQGWVGSYAWSLVVTAFAATTGYLILRRATPKS